MFLHHVAKWGSGDTENSINSNVEKCFLIAESLKLPLKTCCFSTSFRQRISSISVVQFYHSKFRNRAANFQGLFKDWRGGASVFELNGTVSRENNFRDEDISRDNVFRICGIFVEEFTATFYPKLWKRNSLVRFVVAWSLTTKLQFLELVIADKN